MCKKYQTESRSGIFHIGSSIVMLVVMWAEMDGDCEGGIAWCVGGLSWMADLECD